MNTALEYSTRVVQEGGRRCKKSTLNDLVHLTPLRIPLMNPPIVGRKSVEYYYDFAFLNRWNILQLAMKFIYEEVQKLFPPFYNTPPPSSM
jgi:hypothetical protein